jgi:exodeoxyribonuclease VII small subunit
LLERARQKTSMAKKKSASAKTGKTEAPPVDFETALAEVERIVSELEGGSLNLTESLQQYEKGIQYLRQCHTILGAAERKVTLLAGFDADGNPLTRPLAELGSDPQEGSEGGHSALGDASIHGGSMDDSPGLF